MKRQITITIALLCVGRLYIGPADAQPSTQMVETKELISWCADGSPVGSAACTAYIMGIADSLKPATAPSCPGSATRDQIRDAVVNHILTSQPSNIGEIPAAAPVLFALQNAFPCKENR